MPKTKHLLLIFLPALLIVGGALFVRVVQYKPLYPSQEELEAYNDNSLQIPILAGDPILGKKKAPITIVTFEDFSCPACNTQSALLDQLIELHPDNVKVIWKGLPIATYPHNSRDAHLAAFCANEQGAFSEFKQLAFTNADNLSQTIVGAIVDRMDSVNKTVFQNCLDSGRAETYITQTEQIAGDLGIQTLPTIFINNKQIAPPNTLSGWEISLGLTS
jgi:protein-disulfide isomerase